MTTKIEWTWPPWVDKGITLNWVLGCKHAGGPGCDYCWAEGDTWIRQHNRNPKMLKANAGLTVMRDNGRPRWTGQQNRVPERFAVPFRTRRRWGIFAPSKSDPWYEALMADEAGRRFIAAAFGMAAATPQHTYFLLTKRTEAGVRWFEWVRETAAKLGVTPARFCLMMVADQLRELDEPKLARRADEADDSEWPRRNIWVLTSVENQRCYDERVPGLLKMDAAIRGLSAEPLLGPITMAPEHATRLQWVICGGESGSGARPMHPHWARSLRDQCVSAGLPYFFKQWGKYGASGVSLSTGAPTFRSFSDKNEWIHKASSWIRTGDVCVDTTGRVLSCGSDFDSASYPVVVMRKLGKGKAGNALDDRTWEQFPEAA